MSKALPLSSPPSSVADGVVNPPIIQCTPIPRSHSLTEIVGFLQAAEESQQIKPARKTSADAICASTKWSWAHFKKRPHRQSSLELVKSVLGVKLPRVRPPPASVPRVELPPVSVRQPTVHELAGFVRDNDSFVEGTILDTSAASTRPSVAGSKAAVSSTVIPCS